MLSKTCVAVILIEKEIKMALLLHNTTLKYKILRQVSKMSSLP